MRGERPASEVFAFFFVSEATDGGRGGGVGVGTGVGPGLAGALVE